MGRARRVNYSMAMMMRSIENTIYSASVNYAMGGIGKQPG